MLARLSYKQKLKFLGLAILPALFLCYELSFKKTMEEYARFKRAEGQAGAMRASSSVSELEARQARVGRLYDHYMLDTLAFDRNLLAIASNYCRSNGLVLKEYRTVSLSISDSTRVLTRLLTIEGRFIPSLQLIYELETKRNAGRVSSVAYSSVEDRRDKSVRLDCTLYIQNIVP